MTWPSLWKSFRLATRRRSLGTYLNVTATAVCGKEGVTLVVLNTVKRAVDVWKALRADKALKATDADVRLTHSRFRPPERKSWGDAFLNRPACAPGTNRIIVSTQVIEAGVDISASLLVTELAPWTSLVQRFGRCARWGGSGQVIVADFGHDNDRKAAPYSKDALDAARDACGALPDVAPLHLEHFEEENEALLPRLYPYEPRHLLLRHELNDLFDTSPDLSGADVDISRFIRSGNERDVQVFWAEVGGHAPPSSMKPTRDELCSVPFLEARDWLCKPKSEGLNRTSERGSGIGWTTGGAAPSAAISIPARRYWWNAAWEATAGTGAGIRIPGTRLLRCRSTGGAL